MFKEAKGIKLFLIDSCFSGVFNKNLTNSSKDKGLFSISNKNNNIFVFSAANDKEESWEEDRGKIIFGYFSKAVLKTLGFDFTNMVAGSLRGNIYYSDFVNQVIKYCKEDLKTNGLKQHPLGAEVKDFIIFSTCAVEHSL